MTREALGFAVRMERQADIITHELESLKLELEQAARAADKLRDRALALRIRAQGREPELA